MASFSITLSTDQQTYSKKDTIVIANSKDYFTTLTLSSSLSQFAQLSQFELDSVKHGSNHRLIPSHDNISFMEFSFLLNEKPGIRRFIIGTTYVR